MKNCDIYKYALIGALVFTIIIYVFIRKTKNKEGLENSALSGKRGTLDFESINKSIKDSSSQIEDKLLVNKYRKTLEDIIINVDDNVNLQIVNLIATKGDVIAKDATHSNSKKLLETLKQLQDFKGSLNDSMKYLDSMK